MDALVGEWQAGPNDIENLKPYVDALGQPDLAASYANGMKISYKKEGDAYIVSSLLGGAEVFKQKFCPGGKVEPLLMPPGLDVEVTYKVEGNRVIIDAVLGGKASKTVQYIQDGKFVQEGTFNGVTIKMRFSKV